MQPASLDSCNHDPTTPPPYHPTTAAPHHRRSPVRRLVESAAVLLIVLLIFRIVGAEPYAVPTGSMAPTLVGNHKETICPRCGCPIVVGEREGHGRSWQAVCPNCGCDDIPLDEVPVCRGDHLLVNKNVFSWRRPRRWEMAVFRCPVDPGKAYVKRIVGLPGESVELRDGDVWIDGELSRKTLADFKALRVPVFDHRYQPPEGWACRWLWDPGAAGLEGTKLWLDGREASDGCRWLVYQNWQLDEGKARPICDEYTYNGSESARRAEPVHDFMLECDLEVRAGTGTVALSITDGQEEVVVELPVGASKDGARLVSGDTQRTVYRTAPGLALVPGRACHVELAFVDRRVTLAIDGVSPFNPVDRPSVGRRPPVERPMRFGARGVEVTFDNVRLFRDVHYTEAGYHALRQPVRLGAAQYFVLGDNSPNSDDSRFWSDDDDRPLPVPEASFLGKPFLVHMPSRISRWEAFGRHWEYQAIDWGRMRWLR